MRGTVELLQLNPAGLADEATCQTTTARLVRQSERLVKLVRQLLDSSRLGHGEMPLEQEACDLAELCRRTLETLGEASANRVDLECDGPIIGQWDASRIEQVIGNLVSNALRYSPGEGRVRMRLSVDSRMAILEVSDRGIGIPAQQLGQLFTPFFRASNATRADRGGLGLGLYITHEIVRRHGGALRVSSTEGKGTTFTVELPREQN